MSGRELSRFTTENDSNIPVLRKTFAGTKKSKTCTKLPELQKYVETIIKASNEIKPESVSWPDKEKNPKGKHAVCKGLENKIKEDKLKIDVLSNKRKNKRQTSKKYSEAVSRGVEVLHKFFSDFEDPRNWKIQNSGSHLKIERLIEKFYPNPYTIHFENECEKSETQIFFQKVKKDYSGDEALYDVFISKVDAETQDNLENIDFVSADFQIILADRETNSTNASLALSYERLNRPLNKHKNEESKYRTTSTASNLNSIQNTTKTPSIRYSHSVNNVSSRIITAESLNQVNFKESHGNIRKNNCKRTTKTNSKDNLPKVKKLNDVINTDYDLGKLKLLNLSDSESSTHSRVKKNESKNKNNIESDDFVTEISSEICNEISKTNDLNDLLQIYEVMNKATESFLYLTSIKKPGLENGKADKVTESGNINSNTDKSEENRAVEDILEEEKNLETEIGRLENIEEAYDSDGPEQKAEDSIFDANQKINEVLEFMNNCILKFNNENFYQDKKNDEEDKSKSSEDTAKDGEEEKEKSSSENTEKDGEEERKSAEDNVKVGEEEKKKESSENILKDSNKGNEKQTPTTSPESSSSINNSVDSSCPTTSQNQPEVVGRTSKNQNARIRSKRKSKLISYVETRNPSVSTNEPSTSNIDTQVEPNAEIVTGNNEDTIQVAEGLNELGGYEEEAQDPNPNKQEDSRMIKSILPISTKVRRSLPETYKTLKDALETEEKLLKLNKHKNFISRNSERQFLIRNDTITGYYQNRGFEGFNSSFIFCITPFSQSLTTAAVRSSGSITLPKPLSLSLIDFKPWKLKPLPQLKQHHSEKLFISSEIKHRALKLRYSFKIETSSTLNKKKFFYYASPVSFPFLIGFPKIQTENSEQYSKRQIRVKPLKKYSIMNLNTPGTSGLCITKSVGFKTTKSNLLNPTESLTELTDTPVEALLKAIQETENVFLLQQQNNTGLESICSCRSSEENVDNELEKEKDKRKVQNLLLRTYRLQKKLQQYLCNINQSVNPLRSLEKELGLVAEELPNAATTDINAKPETSPPTNENDTKTDVYMVDCGTSYVSPAEEQVRQRIQEESDELPKENTPEEENENDDDDDDRSSTYSFKSSNDFSETNELQNLTQEPSKHMTKGEVIKRIFSQIELLKHNVSPESSERKKKLCHVQEEEKSNNNKLVGVDPKNPAKVLKTVFKGRKSSTELTIGLKDVPMMKVRNISVEKTKFSPNHTKISICISKENGLNSSDNTGTDPLSDKVSSYFLDGMRPSLSMCQTNYTKMDDNVSKSSQSLNERSEEDDDDDDFKSAGSNFVDSTNSSTSLEPEKTKTTNQEVVKISPPKTFNKHRFDFYRKMDMNVDAVRMRRKPPSSAMGKFKELEPLKQALTELQIRMRSIKRDAILNSNDYYERALKLAKMSAGYCQSCGTRAVIPDDTFGYYKTLLPRRSTQRRSRHFKTTITPNSSFYSFRSSNAEVSSQFCDLDLTGSSSFSLNRTTHSNRTVLKSLLQDMPILYEKM